MKRRTFLATLATAPLIPAIGHGAPLDYKPGLINERIDAGETVFLDYKASWCTTCAAQERVLDALKAENPDYEAKITFINIDWDIWARTEVVSSLNVPRRSTLIAIGPDRREIGRIVAGTGRDEIKALMDAALAVASA
jgi:thiol-disulfide isomerase/thioredoxin